MKSIFLFLIIAGVAAYAWTTRAPDAADVFDLAPAAAYEKLRNGKMPNTKGSKTYEYETIIRGNGSDKITLSENSDSHPRCTIGITPDGDVRSKLAVSFDDDSSSAKAMPRLSLDAARKRCIEWVDSSLTDRPYHPRLAKGSTASGWPADVIDHKIDEATPEEHEKHREMEKWRDKADAGGS